MTAALVAVLGLPLELPLLHLLTAATRRYRKGNR